MTIDYKYRVADGFVESCQSCGAEAPVYEFEGNHAGKRYLCELCASSFLGNMTEYPDQYGHGNVTVAQSVAHMLNLVLDRIEDRAPPKPLEMDNTCEAAQKSDQMVCERCSLVWDMNDFSPPRCGKTGEQLT